MPDWDDLRIFLAVVRARTMAGAARRLGVDETTVARRIARLEKRLGTGLVERAPRGLAVTSAGESVRAAAEDMERAAIAAERRAFGAESQLTGRVRITAPELVGSHFVLPALRAVHARHPGLELELITTIVRLDMARREADLAIRTFRPTDPSLVARKLATMAMAPYVRRGTRARSAMSAVAYVSGVKLPMRGIEDRTAVDIALRTNSIATVLAAVRLGLGAGDLPCFLGDTLPELERAFPRDRPEPIGIWLVVHADVQRSARIRVLVDELVRVFRKSAGRLAGS